MTLLPLHNDGKPVSTTTVGAKTAQDVAIVDGSGNQITSFGGGTQYTEGDTDATITGTAVMWEDAGNALVPVSTTKPLPVSASIDTTGLATSAKQDTIIGHVDGVETLLAAIDADTSDIHTNSDTIAAGYATEGSSLGSGVLMQGDDGTDRTNVLVDADGHLQVDVLTMPAGGSGLTDAELRATPVPVSGTVTANAGTNLNTSALALEAGGNLAAIKAKTDNIPALGQALAAASLPVVLTAAQEAALTPPAAITGFATSAKQDTLIGHVDGVETLLGTIDADTSALAGTVAGTEVQVDIVSAPTLTVAAHEVTNAGTFAVQESGAALTALQLIDNAVSGAGFNITQMNGVNVTMGNGASGTGVQRVSIASDSTGNIATIGTSVTPGTAAANLGKAEDAAHSSGDVGVMALAVRKDSSAASSGTSGDYEPLSTDATGKLWIVGTGIEDAAETAGGVLVMAGAVRRDTAASSSGTSGDNSTLNVDALGKLWTTGSYAEDAAHSAGDTLTAVATRRIDTAASSAGTSGDYATLDQCAEGAIWATLTPTTTSGCTIFRSIDLDETEEDIKTTAGNLYGYYFANTNAAARYLKFYNQTAANVVVGTTTPVLTFYLPPTSAGHVGLPFPISFSTAICAAATTGVADNDTGAPGANEVILNAFYK